jgi:two-component system OmpR family sensor kinase
MAPTPGAVEVQAPMDELVVTADASRLRQVLENLLSNALKVQPEGQPVLVVLETNEGSASVTVADNGPGVAPDLVPQLFQRFRAGADSVGLGLGLYLARSITEAHGGTLELDSRPGDGARFVVRLPVTAERAPLSLVREPSSTRATLAVVGVSNGVHMSTE